MILSKIFLGTGEQFNAEKDLVNTVNEVYRDGMTSLEENFMNKSNVRRKNAMPLSWSNKTLKILKEIDDELVRTGDILDKLEPRNENGNHSKNESGNSHENSYEPEINQRKNSILNFPTVSKGVSRHKTSQFSIATENIRLTKIETDAKTQSSNTEKSLNSETITNLKSSKTSNSFIIEIQNVSYFYTSPFENFPAWSVNQKFKKPKSIKSTFQNQKKSNKSLLKKLVKEKSDLKKQRQKQIYHRNLVNLINQQVYSKNNKNLTNKSNDDSNDSGNLFGMIFPMPSAKSKTYNKVKHIIGIYEMMTKKYRIAHPIGLVTMAHNKLWPGGGVRQRESSVKKAWDHLKKEEEARLKQLYVNRPRKFVKYIESSSDEELSIELSRNKKQSGRTKKDRTRGDNSRKQGYQKENCK